MMSSAGAPSVASVRRNFRHLYAVRKHIDVTDDSFSQNTDCDAGSAEWRSGGICRRKCEVQRPELLRKARSDLTREVRGAAAEGSEQRISQRLLEIEMDKERILQNFKKELRSLLIASKHGLSIQELERDYRMLIGGPLPVRKLDYRTAMEMLHDMPDVVNMYTKADGTILLSAVVDEDTKGIASLVAKQKTAVRGKSINKRRPRRPLFQSDLVRRGRMAPVLPPSVRSELRDLLSISPILFSQLESSFYKRFGRSFQYTRYGFYSLTEALRSLSDMVEVKQSRAGSLLLLKTPPVTDIFTGPLPKPNFNFQSVTPRKPPGQQFSAPIDEAQFCKKKPYVEDDLLPAVPTQAVSSPYTGPTPAVSLPYTSPTSAVFPPYTDPTPSVSVPYTGPAPAVSPPYTGPTPAVFPPYTGPTPSVSPPYTGPAPAVSPPYTGPTPTVLPPYAGPTPAVSLPYTGPTPAVFPPYISPTPAVFPPYTGPTPSVSPPYTGPTPAVSPPYTGSTPSVSPPYTGPTPTVFPPYAGPTPAVSPSYTGPTPAVSPTYTGLTPAVSPPYTGLTPLDKLLMAAEAQYYASKRSPKVEVDTNWHVNTDDCAETSKGPENKQVSDGNNNVPIQPSIESICATTNAENTEACKDFNLQDLEAKFEKDLKLSLSMKKAGIVISPEMRQEIKNVVQKYPEGLSISKLPFLYKEHTGKSLPFRDLGFMSVFDLVGSLGDILHMESTRDGEDWCLFDNETERMENVSGKLQHADKVSSWNSSLEDFKCIKPLVIKVSSEEFNKLKRPLNLKLSGTKQEIPPDAVRKQKLCSLPRMKQGSMVGVFVENVISPSEFHVRFCNKESSQKLEDLMLEMRLCYSSEYVSARYAVPEDHISVGEVYALSVAGDVWWYRVIVHSVISSEDVQVYYPDFGNVATVKKSWLRFLKSCYMKLPAQALPSSLAFVTPIESQWSPEAIGTFLRFCTRSPVVGIVCQHELDHLFILLCDTSTDDDVYVHQLLVDSKLATMGRVCEFPKDSPSRNMFVQYLIPSSEYLIPSSELQPEELEELSTIETSTQEFQYNKDIGTEVVEETELEMPFLEAVTYGDDVWDESWFLSGVPVSSPDTKEPPVVEPSEHPLENSSPKPANDCEQNCDADGLPGPLEEFYISLIKSRNTLEKTADSNTPPSPQHLTTEMDPKELTNDIRLPEASKDKNQVKEKKNELEIELQCEDPAEKGCSPNFGFQAFRRRATAAAMGPAALLAASPCSLLHYCADFGKI